MKIIRISAMWCSGCLVMKKAWMEIERKYPNIEYIDYDYDMDEEEIKKFDIEKVVPVNIFMINDKEVNRLVGEKKLEDIVKIIEEELKNEI